MSSGLTLSIMGALSCADASCYMLGAYVAYPWSGATGLWLYLLQPLSPP